MKKGFKDIEIYRERLSHYLSSIGQKTDPDEMKELVNHFMPYKFSKKEMILSAGQHSNTAYFVAEGLVRIYYVKEGKEITNWFIKENMVFAPTYSILTGEANYSNYEAIEDTIVLQIQYAVMESFYAKYHNMEHMGRKLIEAYYGIFMKKTFDVLFLSAEERYSLFIRDNEDLLNRVPLRYIASYLGITQETLSRMRAKY
jgi:CRP-like cAMP-binding protein